MANYVVRDDLQCAVDEMEELRRLIDHLRPVMTAEDHKQLTDLAGSVAACIRRYNSFVLRG